MTDHAFGFLARCRADACSRFDALTSGRLDQPDRSAIIRELLAEAIARRMKKGRSDQG